MISLSYLWVVCSVRNWYRCHFYLCDKIPAIHRAAPKNHLKQRVHLRQNHKYSNQILNYSEWICCCCVWVWVCAVPLCCIVEFSFSLTLSLSLYRVSLHFMANTYSNRAWNKHQQQPEWMKKKQQYNERTSKWKKRRTKWANKANNKWIARQILCHPRLRLHLALLRFYFVSSPFICVISTDLCSFQFFHHLFILCVNGQRQQQIFNLTCEHMSGH